MTLTMWQLARYPILCLALLWPLGLPAQNNAADDSDANDPLLRLFTTPSERQQIDDTLFAPPPPPKEPEEEIEEVEPPPEIHYQGLILRTDRKPLLLINGVLMESTFYGQGFVVKTEQLQGDKVPVLVEGLIEQILLAPGQRINTSNQGNKVLDSYEKMPASLAAMQH